jgi:HSP20 family protein
VIRGEVRTDSPSKDEDYVLVERNLGTYYRRLPLPFQPQPEEIKASFNDGVLEVCIPEPPETRSEAKTIIIR